MNLSGQHVAPEASESSKSAVPNDPAAVKKRKNHRAGKKKRNRRKSFGHGGEAMDGSRSQHSLLDNVNNSNGRPPMYRLGQSGANLSDASLDSQALLDHRYARHPRKVFEDAHNRCSDHPPMRPRRDSRLTNLGQYGPRPSMADQSSSSRFPPEGHQHRRPRPSRAHKSSGGESEEDDVMNTNDKTPLLGKSPSKSPPSYGIGHETLGNSGNFEFRRNKSFGERSTSSKRKYPLNRQQSTNSVPQQEYDVNNPPSVPNSPKVGSDAGFNDVLATTALPTQSPHDRRATAPTQPDYLINIDSDEHTAGQPDSSPPTPKRSYTGDMRRHTMALPAEGDVCFPLEGMSEMAEDDYMTNEQLHHYQDGNYQNGSRRRRVKEWPDLSVLDEWSREEKEVRSEGTRTKKISEPVLVGGRLRPQKNGWHRTEEDAPYRFTYFNEELPSTIHSQTISELLQPGQSFRDLFIPDPPELSDDESDEEDLTSNMDTIAERNELSPPSRSRAGTRQSSVMGDPKSRSHDALGEATPAPSQAQNGSREKAKRYGARPTFWLDVLSPTDTEMRVISKTFGIHPLTAEDILVQEAREKVELFRNYYFVNYRTFEQDVNSDDYLEPINMYVVVFREGVISFHFSMTPHPANVRRRIRQLKDYLILTSDWISYAIIDDITDVFAPLIQSIEEEVDDIDDAILDMHSGDAKENNRDDESSKPRRSNTASSKDVEKRSDAGGDNTNEKTESSGSDMLRRVGRGRKKVMGLYRLLGNKADVIKGFAKRCNEQWEVAPRSEIGLYLGDIQDHLLTMTGNLSHYETLLSRAHSNYLAQINIRMNERQEQTADVLGKLTVLGTIVLPMNIITGMWGMNVMVPGQEVDSLTWFWCITAGLFAFGVSCFFIAKRVYGIV